MKAELYNSIGIGNNDTMRPKEILESFDVELVSKRITFSGIIIGGAALNLLGVVSRPTGDCDILSPEIPPEVLKLATEFALECRARGTPLRDDWLNNGPSSLTSLLQKGWSDRLQPAFSGKAINLKCLGREDLLCTKIFAFCDRGTDVDDCIALAPSIDELKNAIEWVILQDANPDWPKHVKNTTDALARRLGHGL